MLVQAQQPASQQFCIRRELRSDFGRGLIQKQTEQAGVSMQRLAPAALWMAVSVL